MSSLLVISGPNIGTRYELGECSRIGRAPENEIVIADSNVSRVHAEIVRKRMAYTIFDRESRNGVIVNGQPVGEKVLLRNDEIRVGATVFLFNSDLKIHNARFSDNSVYLVPSDDATIELARTQSQLEQLGGRDRESVDFIMRVADLFAGTPAPLSDTAEHLVTQLAQLFGADTAVLFLRDRAGGEMRAVFAVPAERSAQVSRQLVAAVAAEGHALLSGERRTLPPAFSGAFEGPDAPSMEPVDLTTMCAPIVADGETLGVLVVEKLERGYYSLRDLGLLQATARLAAGSIQAALLADLVGAAAPVDGGRVVVSRSALVQEVFRNAQRVAPTDVTVVITGESGTGKEILARHIHESGPRGTGPFVALNCSAIPGTLFESELFGYERGAFTGAERTTAGKVESAHGGTLFLDEIGDLDLSLQPKLLRFLQEKIFYRVGGTRPHDADVRVIAATNQNLEQAVREGRFREDLWYRLSVVQFEMPPLRARREDIAPLVDFFVQRCSARLVRKVLGVNDASVALLQKYDWPGNIRELENAVERAVLLASGRILTPADFPQLGQARRVRSGDIPTMAQVERDHIRETLRRCGWNQAKAAEVLGLHRNTLRNKIAEYELRREE